MAATDRERGRGREARRPGEIPRPGWRDVAWRVKEQYAADHLSLVAAGVAFYGLLAIFPGLAALVSIYGLVADPGGIEQQLQGVAGLPEGARDVVLQQLRRVAGASSTALGTGLVISLGVALWSASKGMKALMMALDIAHDETEERGFVKETAVALAFTFASIVTAVVGLAVVAGIPAVLSRVGLGPVASVAAVALPWLVLLAAVHALLALLYRYGPNRASPRWRWVTPGSVVATVGWALASILFSIYVANFAKYNATYGSLGGVVVMLMWLWISALVVLMGAELNSELERQTRRDSTTGPEAPMGARGAHSADTLGRVP